MRERERTQEQPVHEAEDGDVGGDPQREHEDDERGGAALPQERTPRVAHVRAGHDGCPFVDGDGERHVVAAHGREARADEIVDRTDPDEAEGDAAAVARHREPLGEELLHLVAVLGAQRARRDPEQRAVRAIHLASPVRTRARASRARRPSRSASSVRTRLPVRVRR